MKRFRSTRLTLVVLVTYLCGAIVSASKRPSPPGKPNYNYVSPTFSVVELGNCVDGSRVWIYQPTVLKQGGTADVVIYLHGHWLATPNHYEGHIEHLVKQGNYVIFPQFQEGFCSLGGGFFRGVPKFFGKQSSVKWSIQAAQATHAALQTLPAYNNIYLFGHSLGGALAMIWGSLSSIVPDPITAAVLSSPQPAGYEAIPRFVTTVFFFLFGEGIDVPSLAPQTTFPIAVLYASDDDIAPLTDVWPAYQLLGSSVKAIYEAQSDSHGRPAINANHSVALSSSARDKGQDTLDWRYLWSGLDQVMHGKTVTTLQFDMGSWSDGIPVKPVIRVD